MPILFYTQNKLEVNNSGNLESTTIAWYFENMSQIPATCLNIAVATSVKISENTRGMHMCDS